MTRLADEYVVAFAAAGPGVAAFSFAAWLGGMPLDCAWPFAPFVFLVVLAPGFPLLALTAVRWLPHPAEQLRRPTQWWRPALVAPASVWHLALYDGCSYCYDGRTYVDWLTTLPAAFCLAAASVACWARYCSPQPDAPTES